MHSGNILNFLLAAAILTPALAKGEENIAVYDTDDRLNIYEVAESRYVEFSRSVAAMVVPDKIAGGQLKGSPLTGSGICPSVKFAQEPKVSRCTGFLVAEDVLVTAGHCVTTQADCENYRWVFGYDRLAANQTTYPVTNDDVYRCSLVIERGFERFGDVDHAVLLLDRPVVGRTPLAYRKEGTIDSSSSVTVIGHPLGQPTKVVPDGIILTNSNPSAFDTNLDSFHGTSGSPVFNVETGEVEGILTRGNGDFVWNEDSSCKIIKVCGPGECHPAGVTRISNISYLHRGL
jgi:V8-like Glu-specific endopeptidase